MKVLLKQKVMAALLVIVMLATVVGPVQAKAAEKISKSDFVFDAEGDTYDFLKLSKNDSGYYAYVEAKDKGVALSRGIKMGSTEAEIKAAFGEVNKTTGSAKERFMKFVKYNCLTTDTTSWTDYLEYKYTEKKNTYLIRFYLNKDNKLTAAVYLKNLKNFYNFPNKELKSGLTFVAPQGKKITTKTIDGKKVYMVPEGSQYFRDQKKSTKNWKDIDYRVYLLDEDGEVLAQSESDGMVWGKKAKVANLVKSCLVQDKKTGEWKSLNLKNIGEYKYFYIVFLDTDGTDGIDLAPDGIFFKII